MLFSKIAIFDFFVQKIAHEGKESKCKREVIHEEFLWDYFFQKVMSFLNIFIYCDFFISQIFFDVPPIETAPSFVLTFFMKI